MEKNVYSFRLSLKKGYSPCLYTYHADKIPLGEFDAMLDFKTWSKRLLAINCYFTRIDTAERFSITIYCNYKTGKFVPADSLVDFSTCAINKPYRLTLEKNNNKTVILRKVKVI